MVVTYTRLILDINAPTPAITTAVQQDIHSRYLDVTLTDGGIPVDLRENEVKIFGKKPDGTEFYNNGEVTNATEGRCQFEMTQQALAAVGEVKAQIEIWKIGKGVEKPEVLKNIPFTVNVVTKLRVDKNLESTNEYGTLTMLFHYIQSYFDNIDELLGKMVDLDSKIEALKQASGMKVKSIQHGYVGSGSQLTTSDTIQYSRNIYISRVEISKSIFISDTGMTGAYKYTKVPYLANSNTIKQPGAKTTSGSENAVFEFSDFNWSVVEFY